MEIVRAAAVNPEHMAYGAWHDKRRSKSLINDGSNPITCYTP